MGEIIVPGAEAYAARFTTAEDTLLAEIARETEAYHPHAHMLSGHLQGALLSQLSRLLQPQRILEICTFTGYSALSLATGLGVGGMLHTIELREEEATRARQYFERSAYATQLQLHVGDAKAIVKTLQDQWDLVFIDADKTGYIDYYELILPAVRPNGLIIADNVLFHGQVLQEPMQGKNALAIHAFNEHVRQDDRVEQVLLTVRDGLLIIRKR